jgi:predicted transposase YbfD/YdcC
MEENGGSIKDCFSGITEPRDSNKRHQLLDIITIALCAVICGADTWEEIVEFGHAKISWLRTFLELPHGIPSPDTFARVFASINPTEFREAFLRWVEAIKTVAKGQIIAIDGKRVRHSFNKDKSPIHMVSAWALDNRMVLGQIKTEKKSNEITAIPELLKVLELEDCIVTIDAMGCQKTIAATIVERKADYVLGLKGNQGNLHDDVDLFFKDCLTSGFKDVPYNYCETVDGDHGRIETRRYWTTSDIEWLSDKPLWKNLRTIVMVERERLVENKASVETGYYISSLESDVTPLAKAIRGHWGIENSLHWVLDITFREDESRIRKDHAPENFAILRHLTLNMLRKEPSKRSIKRKRLRAGWDNEYLASIFNA